MPCIDQDQFHLIDHGHDAGVALKQLMRVPAIANGALGDVIEAIRLAVLPMCQFNWIPRSDNNAGSAAGFFRVDNDAPNRIQLKEVRVTVMEDKRSQVVHELVHALDMAYYFFNISHPPTAAGLARRVPVLYLFPIGDVFKYNFMDQPFVDDAFVANHTGILNYCAGLVRNNSLLSQARRDMLMTQLNYAARADKVHVEFTANIAQCLALIYQWGFTGNEKGALGRPRSIALVIRRMESALRAAIQQWRDYTPPPRKVGAVIQFTAGDRRQPALDEPHFASNDWWKTMDPKPLGF
jgi:hypothetical protein